MTQFPDPAAPQSDRHIGLDALRGVAVLGIFMMNIQAFAMIPEAYLNPAAHMDLTGANKAVWLFAHVVFELKFLTIFSVLFGAGVAMMAGGRGFDASAWHFRRMCWLLVAGLLHAYAIWFGDILTFYAIWGLLTLAMVDRPPAVLIGAGLFLTAITGLSFWANYSEMASGAGYMPADWWRPGPAEIRDSLEIARAGWLERVTLSAPGTFEKQASSLVYHGPRILGLMLIGAALYRIGFLTGGWPARRYALCALISLPAGLGLSALSAQALLAGDFRPEAFAQSVLLIHSGSLAAAFGYGCLVMLAARPAALQPLVAPFAAVGRMALTNYIAQSLIAAFIFFGPPGLGLIGEIERTGQLMIVLAVWAAQLVWSPLWLAVFRFGPLEWVWRSLTYGRAQPMLRRRAV